MGCIENEDLRKQRLGAKDTKTKWSLFSLLALRVLYTRSSHKQKIILSSTLLNKQCLDSLSRDTTNELCMSSNYENAVTKAYGY